MVQSEGGHSKGGSKFDRRGQAKHDLLKTLRPDRGIQREISSLVTRTALTPASDETRQQWRQASDKLVKERYGADGAKLLAAVRELVAKEPVWCAKSRVSCN